MGISNFRYLVGSIWAYYELGWGGFWFWDPVENASLLPWFAMTALFHSLIVLEKRNLLYFWVIILCLMTFILSVTGTFLVRSGILNSVHTFASDPSRGIYILIFLSLMIFTSIFLFFKKYQSKNYFINSNSKETFVLINNWFMLFYLLTVLIGTLYPIFTDAITQNKISVGPPFYNTVIIPIVIIFLFFMALGPNSKWIKNKFNNYTYFATILVAALIINFFIIYFFKSYTILSNLVMISSLFLIISSFLDFKKNLKNKFDLSRVISHLSFGFLIFFIGLNHNFSIEKDFNMKVGEVKNFENYQISLKKLKLQNYNNYKAIIGDLEIKNTEQNEINNLNPQIRIYDSPKTMTYEAAIQTRFVKDYYITMSNIDRSEFYNIKFQKTANDLDLLSVIALAFGGFLRVFKMQRTIKFIIILISLFIISIFSLSLGKDQIYNTEKILIGKKLDQLSLKSFDGDKSFNTNDFKKNNFTLINFWASWCAPCRIEHPILMNLQKTKKLKLVGINFKDKKNNAKIFLQDLGNPYHKIAKDENGKKSVIFGIYGIPESILINEELIVIHKFVGPLSNEDYDKILEIIN